MQDLPLHIEVIRLIRGNPLDPPRFVSHFPSLRQVASPQPWGNTRLLPGFALPCLPQDCLVLPISRQGRQRVKWGVRDGDRHGIYAWAVAVSNATGMRSARPAKSWVKLSPGWGAGGPKASVAICVTIGAILY